MNWSPEDLKDLENTLEVFPDAMPCDLAKFVRKPCFEVRSPPSTPSLPIRSIHGAENRCWALWVALWVVARSFSSERD